MRGRWGGQSLQLWSYSPQKLGCNRKCSAWPTLCLSLGASCWCGAAQSKILRVLAMRWEWYNNTWPSTNHMCIWVRLIHLSMRFNGNPSTGYRIELAVSTHEYLWIKFWPLQIYHHEEDDGGSVGPLKQGINAHQGRRSTSCMCKGLTHWPYRFKNGHAD